MRRLFVLLLLWCAALLALRISRTGTATYVFLVWNLCLATIPFAAAERLQRSTHDAARAAWLVVWLLFLPNAPYLLTDLIHLRHRPPAPLWYDLALLLSCAGTGLLLAYASLAIVQSFLARRFGERLAWCFAVSSLVLSAFGIYLGRFLRWNSWDVLTNPLALLASIFARVANPLAHPRTVAVTVIFGGMLTLGYVVIRQRFWSIDTPSPCRTAPRISLD